jgi:hypothetical protein
MPHTRHLDQSSELVRQFEIESCLVNPRNPRVKYKYITYASPNYLCPLQPKAYLHQLPAPYLAVHYPTSSEWKILSSPRHLHYPHQTSMLSLHSPAYYPHYSACPHHFPNQSSALPIAESRHLMAKPHIPV